MTLDPVTCVSGMYGGYGNIPANFYSPGNGFLGAEIYATNEPSHQSHEHDDARQH
jgi:hypothetical protein